MDLWVALMDMPESEEHILGVYSSEELALDVANLASTPEEGRVRHYVLDEIPDWIEDWLAELAVHGEAESA